MTPRLPAGFRIQPAGKADLPALAALESAPGREGGGLPLAALDLCRAAGTLWAGLDQEGRPVAHLAAGEADGSLLILGLGVHPAQRRRGLGGALLAAALDHARWAFYPAASVVAERPPAEEGRFLAAHGFLLLRSDALSPALGHHLAARIAAGGDPERLCAMAKRL